MARLLLAVILLISLEYITCPPVTPAPKKPAAKVEEEETDEKEDLFGLEYERYLKEVVSVLESDEQFRKKLEQSNISDIKSGEIAKHLEFVGHGVRSKLDEIKRKEVDRLRQILRLQQKVKNGLKTVNKDFDIPGFDKDLLLSHLDHKNPNTFEVDDLAKLIKQATGDLEDLDNKRRDEFKEYELEKEHLRKEKLNSMDEAKRKEELDKFEELQKKHKEHPKLHHPGSKDQLEEVWEESDGLNKDDFDPRTFFFLHDTNSDGYLDEEEVEALFQKELDKVYDPNAPEDDMMERYEEMNRMREHVMNEVDQDKDKLISLKEFMESTRGDEFEKDEGWEGLDEQKLYTDEELAEFEREYEARRQQQFGGHAQPGEVNIPAQDRLQGEHDPEGQQQMHQRPPEVPQPVQHQQQQDIPQQQQAQQQAGQAQQQLDQQRAQAVAQAAAQQQQQAAAQQQQQAAAQQQQQQAAQQQGQQQQQAAQQQQQQGQQQAQPVPPQQHMRYLTYHWMQSHKLPPLHSQSPRVIFRH